MTYDHPEQVARETATREGVVAYLWKGSDADGETRQYLRSVLASPGSDELGAGVYVDCESCEVPCCE